MAENLPNMVTKTKKTILKAAQEKWYIVYKEIIWITAENMEDRGCGTALLNAGNKACQNSMCTENILQEWNCCGLTMCVLPKSICWNLTTPPRPAWWWLEVGTFEGDQITRQSPGGGITALVKDTAQALLAPPPWKDTARSPSEEQGVGPPGTLTLLAPRSWTCSLQNCEMWTSVVYEPPSLCYFITVAWMD